MNIVRNMLIVGSLAALMAATAAQAQMYRWTDEHGVVHYTDSPPPEAARQERRVLDDRGITVRTLERARTEEELEQQRQEQARAEAERQAREEQERRDRVLLQSFGTERELLNARDDRLAMVDSQISITREKIRTLEQQQTNLEERRRRLAAQEREIPEGLEQDIASTQRQILVQQRHLEERQLERERLVEQFDADLKRLRELKAAGR
ncbi:hypothetical protein Tgr7_0105 [Thioalkalivibrio sulfidiphilus HL-EbGr7]|uniref:DUF4124 domain-containing protein n=1 Tax=Thioalkalivibrio sulfidiphilus (strain HL-EbGR7) TaxID=396588 RepID=B8GTE8_THISH|nr:DUF4124 domain-containing protein [Thioalkalivibrio sulfidiphilus]ACL71208.1 hypothetical protein Tgr7_0105 [Thioalkalivibrio sulfidiphilus HL-EbGr7]